MPQLPSGKKGVYFYIDAKVLEEFRALAFQKHVEFNGALSYEAEEALRNWILLHTQNHTKQLVVSRVNPTPKVYKAFVEVKNYLKEKYGYVALTPGQSIIRQHLVEAIGETRGSDERTIMNWLKRFLMFKLVKWVAGEVYEVL